MFSEGSKSYAFFMCVLIENYVSFSETKVIACTENLQQIISSIIKNDSLLVDVPTREQHTFQTRLTNMPNLVCNQAEFFNNLKQKHFFEKPWSNPKFLVPRLYQNIDDNCYVMILSNRNLHYPNKVRQIPQSQQCRLTFFYDFARPGQPKTIHRLGPNRHQPITISYPKDADVFLNMYHIIASFFERYADITYQLWVASEDPDLRQITKPCYVPLSELPRLQSLNYTQSTSPLHANEIQPCDPQLWTRILPESPTHFKVSFPSGKLIPFVPINPNNNRVYYRRVATTSPDDPIFWFTLDLIVGKPLQAFQPQVRLIHWGYSHLLEHKSLFLTPTLQAQNTPILYLTPTTNGSPHNESQPNFLNVFPFQVSFTNPPNYLTQPVPYRNWCDVRRIQKSHQPYGSLEIDLLKIRPPTNSHDYCKRLPDAQHPNISYANLQTFIKVSTNDLIHFFSGSLPSNTRDQLHTNIAFQNQNISLPSLLQDYEKFIPATRHYTRLLHQAQLDARFAYFNVTLLQQTLIQQNFSQATLDFLKNTLLLYQNRLFSSRQYTRAYAKQLWRLHFIKQNILQKALQLWRMQQVIHLINTSNLFSPDEIYEHSLLGNLLTSTNRFRILNNKNFGPRYTIPSIITDQETFWNPGKIAALFTGTLALTSTFFYGIYNLFCTASQTLSHAVTSARVSLALLHNKTQTQQLHF